MKAVFDTNILIDYLNGEQQALNEIESFKTPLISIITYMEVMVGADSGNEAIIEKFLKSFQIEKLTKEIADEAIKVRKKLKMKLPDSIIMATAIVNDAMLVTRNTKDFPQDDIMVRVPYII